MRFTLRLPGIAADSAPVPPNPTDVMFALINEARAVEGLAPYRRLPVLDTAAQIRTNDMVARNYFGHDTPDGRKGYTDALAYLGVSYAWAGENLAMNNYRAETSAVRAHGALLASPTHRANILEPVDFDSVGIGFTLASDGRRYYAQIFGGRITA